MAESKQLGVNGPVIYKLRHMFGSNQIRYIILLTIGRE